jgi:tetratricopeptide (TPR) repeat protein
MGAHGMVDVVFYGKVSMPLVGIALGMAWRADPRIWLGEQRSAKAQADKGRRRAVILASGGVIAALAAVMWGRQALALGFANLGALGQTRLEMTAYDPDHFDAPRLDEIRRRADLAWVEGSFRRALEIDPAQRTALQRLAQIELSRGETDRALAHAEAARRAGYRDDVTRLLYGDALAAAGDVEAAVEAVSGIDQAAGRLLFQGWYRYWLAGDYQRAAQVWQAALLLEPGNAQARSLLEQAQAALAEGR